MNMSNHIKILCLLSSLNFFLLLISVFIKLLHIAQSRTFPGDILVLKDLRKGLDPNSITPRSCLSSWDFSLVHQMLHLWFQMRPSRPGQLLRFTRFDRLEPTLPFWQLLPRPYSLFALQIDRSTPACPLYELAVNNNHLHGPIPPSFNGLVSLKRL